MKTVALLVGGLLPFAAFAEERPAAVDPEELKGAIPATLLMEEDVVDEEGREVGDVEDILVERGGKLRVVLVDAEDYDGDALQLAPEERTESVAGDPDLQSDWTAKDAEAERGSVEWGEDLVPLSPRDVSYDSEEEEVVVRSGSRAEPMRESEREDMLHLSELIGMEVNLADEDSFGEVEDVMLDNKRSRIVALVVDNWDGLDKQRRAFPMKDAVIMSDEEEVVYPYTKDQLAGLGEFDLDEYEDSWED